jgi:A/G-specific adenine glycosylase
VLARAVAGRRLAQAEAQELADRLVPPRTSWAWNQAMLDLGATVCTARQPSCRSCPLGPRSPQTATGRPVCAWAAAGGPDPAFGSAGTSRPQSKFAGSDRQGRGRLLAHLAAAAVVGSGEVRPADLAAAAGWPGEPNRALAAARSLVADGLAVTGPGGTLRLP